MAYSIRRYTVKAIRLKRQCYQCGHAFDAAAEIANETFLACFECDACRVPIWLQTATDPNYEIFSLSGLKIPEIKSRIEALIPPCPNCSGKLRMVDWYRYGAPTRCPKCGVLQKEVTLLELRDKSKSHEVEEEQLWLIAEGAPIPPELKNSRVVA